MSKEIERKYLVANRDYRAMAVKVRHIEQGYLSRRPEGTVRVRIADDKGYLTVKGRNRGATRDEWEYEIPEADARAMLQRCCSGAVVIKDRYLVPYQGRVWEVDEFAAPKVDLVVAEVELPSEDAAFALPPFVGQEVTGNPDYYNSNIG